MAAYKGKYKPKNPQKYEGDVSGIVYRSLMERTLMKAFDSDPAVLSWQSEEFFIPYISPIDNKSHKYYVDFCIEKVNSKGDSEQVIIEVKPYSQTLPPKPAKKETGKARARYQRELKTYLVNQAKWEAARKFAESQGMKFIILTEKEIKGQ